ncbi:MAG TPA: transglutaminase-like domain-containing protein [Vicinamibacterales bacterium]|jgi:regulator of sirC expression with transglutaminase-like and TPR domain
MRAPLSLVSELQQHVAADPIDLARSALVIAKLEYPHLRPGPSLDVLEQLGERAKARLAPLEHAPVRTRIDALNRLIYGEERFTGNRAHYDDFRNSLLNLVLERRVGIPISLALVYMEVARRADLDASGIAFPGHFLVRVAAGPDAVILDPFDAGAEVDEAGCRALLTRHAGEDAALDPAMLRPCTPRQFLTRMLNNLKRTYVEWRSFPQARWATELLLTTDPTILSELRDRGLLAYHLDDFPAALRDLEEYLRLNSWAENADREERDQIWEHIKNLRRRVAGMN